MNKKIIAIITGAVVAGSGIIPIQVIANSEGNEIEYDGYTVTSDTEELEEMTGQDVVDVECSSEKEGKDSATTYEYALEDGIINGRALVLPLKVMAMEYDKLTRIGIMRVRFAPGQLEVAREYLRRDIESVAKDKNIALLFGKDMPSSAKYYLLDETLNDGMLSIKFKAE